MTQVQECLINNIKKYRKLRHLTQEQLAEKTNSSTNYIGTIETGKKFPSLNMIERIAEALEISSLLLFQSENTDYKSFNKNEIKKIIIENLSNSIDKSIDDFSQFLK